MSLLARFTREISSDFRVDADLMLTSDAFEVTVLFGPSGAGKTSILRAIAGLDRPGSGRIECDGETWFDGNSGIHVPTRRRRIGFLFQHYALFPHLSTRAISSLVFAGSREATGERGSIPCWISCS